MPHNKIRIWVGVAIVAITIPAVGQYVLSSRTDDSQGQLPSNSAKWLAGEAYAMGGRPSSASQTPPRDYAAEVATSTHRHGGLVNEYDTPEYYDSLVPYDEYDDSFTNEPLQEEITPTRDVPDGSDELAPNEVTPNDTTTDVGDDELPVAEAPANAGPSDREVYQSMLASVSGDDREDFVRAWAAMSPEQREEAIDRYRESNPIR